VHYVPEQKNSSTFQLKLAAVRLKQSAVLLAAIRFSTVTVCSHTALEDRQTSKYKGKVSLKHQHT